MWRPWRFNPLHSALTTLPRKIITRTLSRGTLKGKDRLPTLIFPWGLAMLSRSVISMCWIWNLTFGALEKKLVREHGKTKRLRSSNTSKHQFEVELLHWQKQDIYWHSYPSSHGSSFKAILIYLEIFFLNDPNQLGRPPKKHLAPSTNQNNSQLAPSQVHRAAAYFVGSNCSNLPQHPKDGEVAFVAVLVMGDGWWVSFRWVGLVRWIAFE